MPGYRAGSGNKPQHGSLPSKKLSPQQVAQNAESGATVVICCEADEQWSYVRSKGNPRWLFYAYDRIRKRVLAHVFDPRNALTLQRLLALLGRFNIAFYMTDAWPVYQTLLAATSHVISKKYTQRIERHNLNLRTINGRKVVVQHTNLGPYQAENTLVSLFGWLISKWPPTRECLCRCE